MFYTNNRLRALAVGLALGLASLPFPGGHAQAATAEAAQQQYNIAAGPLNTVLTRFADVSGSLIAGNLQLAADKQSQGVSGSFTPDQALARILAGTGLVADRDPDGAYVLRDAEAAGTNKLSPVSVTAPTQYSVQNSLSYDRGRIEALQPQDMKDLFKNESSVSVGGSIPINQKVYVRGVEETAMLVTVDGARQNNKVFHYQRAIQMEELVQQDLESDIKAMSDEVDSAVHVSGGGVAQRAAARRPPPSAARRSRRSARRA